MKRLIIWKIELNHFKVKNNHIQKFLSWRFSQIFLRREVRIIKQNSFKINIFLDEDRIDKETVMYHIYHAIQNELNNGNVNYMNLIVTPSKSYGDLLKEDKR